jgi:hypothetical protein
MNEKDRLSFIERRDGVQGALSFARQGYTIYRRSVLQSAKRGYGVKVSAFADTRPHHASFREYRKAFIESYLCFKRYIKENSK